LKKSGTGRIFDYSKVEALTATAKTKLCIKIWKEKTQTMLKPFCSGVLIHCFLPSLKSEEAVERIL
jgi:hypothetical protein